MAPCDPIDKILHDAVEQGVFPGAVLLVQIRGRPCYRLAVGRTASPPTGLPTTIDTVYDLASLTKPLGTTSGLLLLVHEGKLELDRPVGDVLEELQGSAVGAVTIRHLLAHRSGLPAWRPYYERLTPPEAARRDSSSVASRHMLHAIRNERLDGESGTTRLYSDLGFILLGMVIERLAAIPLDRFCETRIFRPLGAYPLGFLRSGAAPARSAARWANDLDIAPTEQEPWRGRLLCGEVHDNNAYALGGVAGHAGLFGTAAAVAAVAQAWLDAVHGRRTIFDPELAQAFVGWPEAAEDQWILGWDTPTPPSSSGRYLSPRSFGHLGFTGTSLWIDPSAELIVVLLSNRVHPTRENIAIQTFRPLLHDRVYEQVIERTYSEVRL